MERMVIACFNNKIHQHFPELLMWALGLWPVWCIHLDLTWAGSLHHLVSHSPLADENRVNMTDRANRKWLNQIRQPGTFWSLIHHTTKHVQYLIIPEAATDLILTLQGENRERRKLRIARTGFASFISVSQAFSSSRLQYQPVYSL